MLLNWATLMYLIGKEWKDVSKIAIGSSTVALSIHQLIIVILATGYGLLIQWKSGIEQLTQR